ncbi:integrase [Yersinia enterocolitica]|nr:integrase [Yersinia enterocolitica]
MKLNARQVDTAKRKEKPYKLSDGGGLFLLVNTNGSRYWRLKYRAIKINELPPDLPSNYQQPFSKMPD